VKGLKENLKSANRPPLVVHLPYKIFCSTDQERRLEEVQETHRLECASRSERLERLRRQFEEAEALLNASHDSMSQANEEIEKRKIEIKQLELEVKTAKSLAKEEEEKRVKAISLLKTVRAKLVKAEKEKEDAVKDINLLRGREAVEKEQARAELERSQSEVVAVQAEKEKAVAGLKNHFDSEVANVRDRFEKEMIATRGQFELEAITLRVRCRFLPVRLCNQTLCRIHIPRNSPTMLLSSPLSKSLSAVFLKTRILSSIDCKNDRRSLSPRNINWSLFKLSTRSFSISSGKRMTASLSLTRKSLRLAVNKISTLAVHPPPRKTLHTCSTLRR
jgi:hypothetical protein